MSVISETYGCLHNILELADILPSVSFTTGETERDLRLEENLKTPWNYSLIF